MPKSMTGFGSAQGSIPKLGKVQCEVRSINHRFLEVIFHLPEGFSYLEERIKKELEKKLRRGRVTFVLRFIITPHQKVMIDTNVLKGYFCALEKMRKELRSSAAIDISRLISLPGVVNLGGSGDKNHIWPDLRAIVASALDNLVVIRIKEGKAIGKDIKKRIKKVQAIANGVTLRFKKVINQKSEKICNLDERSAFLKAADITEELVRVKFHLKNFISKLATDHSIGKELDFIAQELQRETNTIGAKSQDATISGSVVTMKSEIEKIREQLQNVE